MQIDQQSENRTRMRVILIMCWALSLVNFLALAVVVGWISPLQLNILFAGVAGLNLLLTIYLIRFSGAPPIAKKALRKTLALPLAVLFLSFVVRFIAIPAYFSP